MSRSGGECAPKGLGSLSAAKRFPLGLFNDRKQVSLFVTGKLVIRVVLNVNDGVVPCIHANAPYDSGASTCHIDE